MKPKKFYIKKLYDRMYSRHIWLLVGSEEDYRRYLQKHYKVVDAIDASGEFRTLSSGRSVHYIIWLESFEFYANEFGALGHEIFHAVMGILRDLGMKYQEDGEEAFSYYVDCLLTECLKALNRRKKKC